MRDLFSPVAPSQRDQGMSDAQHRAAKAANVPIFTAPPSPARNLAAKAEQTAAEIERQTRERITARPVPPSLEERRSKLPQSLRAKAETGAISTGAAELLGVILARWSVDQQPVRLTSSGVAVGMRISETEAAERISELAERSFILATTTPLGERGFRPNLLATQ